MLKANLQKAVEELKTVYTKVLVRPGSGEGVIDIALEPAGMHASNGDLAALKILSANGLQPFGYVHSKDFKTLFLRNITEIPAAVCGPQPEVSPE
jgi:microsomal dipeptidase-like Zn-dependent dipeptidase